MRTNPRTIKEVRNFSAHSICESLKIPRDTAVLEADLLLVHALDGSYSRIKLLSELEIELSEIVLSKFNEFLERRLQGEPIEYIINKKEFFNYEFFVDNRVLIPRSDTEILVEKALAEFSKNESEIIDIGTGSGAIIASILSEIKRQNKKTNAYAIDISNDALEVAKVNFKNLSLTDYIKCFNGAFFEPILAEIDKAKSYIIVSNPPYIDYEDTEVSESVRKYEPHTALFSEDRGLQHIKKIIEQYVEYFVNQSIKSSLFIEIGYKQKKYLSEYLDLLLKLKYSFVKDIEGRDRVLEIFPRTFC